jgi:hypothetical protein
MVKKCQPGVICIENITLVILIILFSVIFYLIFQNKNNSSSAGIFNGYSNKYINQYNQSSLINSSLYNRINNVPDREILSNDSLFIRPNPSYGYTLNNNDVLLNPYAGPLKDDRYFQDSSLDIRGPPNSVPINVKTSVNAVDTSYRQIGIVKRLDGTEMVLPLMGRPLMTSRDKWNFYTMNENNIKLPVRYKNRSCTDEYGCDNIYSGDVIDVEGLDKQFKVTMYENSTMKYIPFL